MSYVTKLRLASASGGFLYLELLTALETEKFKAVSKLPAREGASLLARKIAPLFVSLNGKKGIKKLLQAFLRRKSTPLTGVLHPLLSHVSKVSPLNTRAVVIKFQHIIFY